LNISLSYSIASSNSFRFINLFILLIIGLSSKILSVKEIEDLGSLPSLDELRAKIVGLLTAPAQKIASLNVNVASQLVRILASKPDK